MAPHTKRAAIAAVGALTVVSLAACGGGGGGGGGATQGGSSAEATKGGTLQYVTFRGSAKWDPQVIYIGAHIQFANRVFARTLTTFAPGEKVELVADAAQDTGKSLNGGKDWEFTIKDGIKWEDGQPVTCEDFKYGVSKTFDPAYAGGPQYAKQFLNIPKDAKGVSTYGGPYTGKNQDAFDKAVTCAGNKLTYHLNRPVADFNWAVYLTAFAAARKDKDQGAKGFLNIFSDGPYKLQGGKWDPVRGGTFVRNEHYDPSTDEIRKAYPDQIVWTQGVQTETIYQRLIADGGNDKFMVTDREAPPAFLGQLAAGPVKARTVNVNAPYVHYLALNMRRLKDVKIRQAFQVATDRQAYIAAAGGPQTGVPATAIMNPDIKGYKQFDPFQGAPASGDPDKAKALLAEAGVQTPYPLKVVYNQTPTADKQFSALKTKWDAAGFATTIEGQPDTDYYGNIQTPAKSKDYDVMWGGWGADWPAGSTVLPPLFDSRINLTADGSSSGSDYGFYDNDETNAMMDQAFSAPSVEEAAPLWGDIDEKIVKTDAAAVPLQVLKFTFTHGSGVKNFQVSPALGGYVDLADIAVK